MIGTAARGLVRDRAQNRCEYCGLRQALAPLVLFHIEHIVPKKHGGSDDPSNLALACHHCNEHKGPNLAGLDPASGAMVPLFNPRTQVWAEHFRQRGSMIEGRTAVGRTTVRVLAMNADQAQELRAEIAAESGPEES